MNRVVKVVLWVLTAVAVIALLWYFKALVIYVSGGALVSLIGAPLMRVLLRVKLGRFKISRTIAAATTLLAFWAVVITIFSIFIPNVIEQTKILSSANYNDILLKLEEPIGKIEEAVSRFNFSEQDRFSLKQYIREKVTELMNVAQFSEIFGSVATVLIDILVGMFAISFISFFFLKEEHLFTKGISLFFPERLESHVQHALLSIRQLLSRYFLGMFLDVVIITVLVTIGLWIVGLPLNQAMVAGLAAGVMNVIPYLGPLIGLSFGLTVTLVSNLNLPFDQLSSLLLLVLVVFMVVQLLDYIVFQPYIYSNSVRAHPLEIFLLILAAASVAGVIGMVLAIPSYTIVRVIGKEFFNRYEIVKKLTRRV